MRNLPRGALPRERSQSQNTTRYPQPPRLPSSIRHLDCRARLLIDPVVPKRAAAPDDHPRRACGVEIATIIPSMVPSQDERRCKLRYQGRSRLPVAFGQQSVQVRLHRQKCLNGGALSVVSIDATPPSCTASTRYSPTLGMTIAHRRRAGEIPWLNTTI